MSEPRARVKGGSLAILSLIVLLESGVAAAQQAPAPASEALPNANSPAATAGDRTYRVFADVVTSGVGRPGVQGVPCVAQSVFFPGDTIVFRAVIADGPSGTPLSSADIERLGVQAVVTLSDGSRVPLKFESHPPVPNAPVHRSYWAGALHTAPDHPTGTLKWTLNITDKAGHHVTFVPLGQDVGAAVLQLAARKPGAQ
jgi:hypothetical protein